METAATFFPGAPEDIIGSFSMSSSTPTRSNYSALWKGSVLKYSQAFFFFARTIPRVRAQRLRLARPARHDTARLFHTASSTTGRLNPVMFY